MKQFASPSADFDSAERIEDYVKENIGLLHMVVKRYNNVDHLVDYEERLSLCYVGVIRAFQSYDESKGASFSTYAILLMNNEILKHLRSINRGHKRYNFVSFQDAIGDDGKGNVIYLEDVIADDSWSEDQYIHEKWQRESLSLAINILNEDEKKMIDMAFFQNLSQREIAEHFGIAQSYVSRKLKAMLRKMRKEIEKHE